MSFSTSPIDPLQTLTEDQFSLIENIKSEYETGMLALNSLSKHTATVYGGSLVKIEDYSYQTIKDICISLAKHNWSVVSGGGPGMMSAALSGAKEGGGKAIAFCINIPGEPPFDLPDVSITFSQFAVRKYLLRQSDIFIFAPGGIGTLDELMEVLTLIKTHKHPIKPIFLYDSSFWNGYLEWFKQVLIDERKVVFDDLFDLFHVVDSKQEILKILGYDD
jgi:uncharacterized protein (TIGR00730 family)